MHCSPTSFRRSRSIAVRRGFSRSSARTTSCEIFLTEPTSRERLRLVAFAAMRARGLEPDFPPDALAQVAAERAAPRSTEEPVRDLRSLLWCSIDNDESRDLDQL